MIPLLSTFVVASCLQQNRAPVPWQHWQGRPFTHVPFLPSVLSSPCSTPTVHQHTIIHLLTSVPLFMLFLFSGTALPHPHPPMVSSFKAQRQPLFHIFPSIPPLPYRVITSSCVFKPILYFTSAITLIKWHYLYLCVSPSCDLLEEGVTSCLSLCSCFLDVSWQIEGAQRILIALKDPIEFTTT